MNFIKKELTFSECIELIMLVLDSTSVSRSVADHFSRLEDSEFSIFASQFKSRDFERDLIKFITEYIDARIH